jgi:hypothetical protein
MLVKKKEYVSPGVESERLDLPTAFGCGDQCDVHLANSSAWYYGDAYGYQVPTFNC